MNRSVRVIGLAAVVLALAAIGAWITTRATDPDVPAGAVSPPTPLVSSTGVDEPFELFDGDAARLSDWRGTPLVVNFWASWCPPCVAEMRDALEPSHQQFGDEVVFVGLNLRDTAAAANAVVEQTGVTYTLGRDPAGDLFTTFGGFGMPTTVFIDANGAVVDSHTGAFTFDQLQALIQSNLGV